MARKPFKHEDVYEIFKSHHLEMLTEYKNNTTKITLKCKNGHLMNVTWGDYKRRKNTGCNICKNRYTEIWEKRIGIVYNELTLVKHLGDGICLFNCSCGKESQHYFYDVEIQKVKSCGHLFQELKLEDLTGTNYGYLTAIQNLGLVDGQANYLFECKCGNIIQHRIKEARRGKLNSCGCIAKNNGKKNITHGMSNTRLYSIWRGMIQRCEDKNFSGYDSYGSRGVKVCENWRRSFMHFFNWAVYNNYAEHLTIDRIDVNGNYEPQNCRWADLETQANNKTTNLYFTYNDKTLSLAQWSRELDLDYQKLWKRIRIYGYSFEEAIK